MLHPTTFQSHPSNATTLRFGAQQPEASQPGPQTDQAIFQSKDEIIKTAKRSLSTWERARSSLLNALARLTSMLWGMVSSMTRFLYGQYARFLPRIMGLQKADQSLVDILSAHKDPAKVATQDYEKPSIGIAKASRVLSNNDKTYQTYKDWEYLNIHENYGVAWDDMKIVRDTLQNFYDGQGGTLEGVKTEIREFTEEIPDFYFPQTKHHIKISGSATYDPDMLLALGAGSKHRNKLTVGGFGEGAKTIAFSLLRDFGAETVTFRSGEWQAEFKLGHPGAKHGLAPHERGLMLKLSLLDPPIEGNNFEFTTDMPYLSKLYRQGAEMFYDPTHETFTNPTYQNQKGGFKLIDPEQEGRAFEVGQYREALQNLTGLNVWSFEKLSTEPDRDRTYTDVRVMLESIVNEMTTDEAKNALKLLKPYWFTSPLVKMQQAKDIKDKMEELSTAFENAGSEEDLPEEMQAVARRIEASGIDPDELNPETFDPELLQGVFDPKLLKLMKTEENRQAGLRSYRLLIQLLCRRLAKENPSALKDLGIPKGAIAESSQDTAMLLHESGYIPVQEGFANLPNVKPSGKLATALFSIQGNKQKLAPKTQQQVDLIKSLMEYLSLDATDVNKRARARFRFLKNVPVSLGAKQPQFTDEFFKPNNDSALYYHLALNRVIVNEQTLATRSFEQVLQDILGLTPGNDALLLTLKHLPQLRAFRHQWNQLIQQAEGGQA